MNQTIHNLLTGQLASWETARNNYAALSGVRVKELNVNGIPYKVQFNPARIVSSGAKVDTNIHFSYTVVLIVILQILS